MLFQRYEFVVFRSQCPKDGRQQQQAKIREWIHVGGIMRDQVCAEPEISRNDERRQRNRKHRYRQQHLCAFESATNHSDKAEYWPSCNFSDTNRPNFSLKCVSSNCSACWLMKNGENLLSAVSNTRIASTRESVDCSRKNTPQAVSAGAGASG